MNMFRAVLALLALSCACAQAECLKNRAALLPITLWQGKLYVPVTVNGTAETFFIDTGAATTTLSSAVAGSLDIPRDFTRTADVFGVGGKESHLYIGEVESLSLAGLTLSHQDFPVADFGQRMADGLTPAGGLIGADILSRFDLEIDIPNRQLGLWRVTGCTDLRPDWEGEVAAVPMQIMPSRHVTVPVRIDGASLDLLLDTGSADLLLSTGAAARAGATPEILDESRQLQGYGVNERSFRAWYHIFRRLDVGREIFGDVHAVIVSNGRYANIGDGLFGVEFLKRGRVWVSYSTGTFFMQASRGG
jgi:predicted aspartyl protease